MEKQLMRCSHSTDNMTIAGCLIFDAVFYTLKPDNFTIQFVFDSREIIEPQRTTAIAATAVR